MFIKNSGKRKQLSVGGSRVITIQPGIQEYENNPKLLDYVRKNSDLSFAEKEKTLEHVKPAPPASDKPKPGPMENPNPSKKTYRRKKVEPVKSEATEETAPEVVESAEVEQETKED